MTAGGLYAAAKRADGQSALARFWQAARAGWSTLVNLAPGVTDAQRAEAEALNASPYRYALGDRVSKTGGDYVFAGWIMMRGQKRSGAVRYAVENAQGLVHIFNESQLSPGWPDEWTERDIP